MSRKKRAVSCFLWNMAYRVGAEAARIDMHIAYDSNVGTCPVCGAADQRVHDRHKRTWEHLHFF